ncbi:MAG: FlgD immunoglobulin-like domain containing protein, partial [Rhodothermales bacterium]|nr:FlgD immunoglobulin-like domain containing protein [Rhodothermales bacterium]
GDGRQELLLTSNQSGSSNDYFFIYSVTGTFEPNSGGGFETWVNELTLARGTTASDNGLFNFDTVGGGSPYAIHPADLDGDGTLELSLHAWNSYNFFNIDVAAADTYLPPDAGQPNPNIQASATDNVSLFAGVVVDIDNNGDDEVFYPEFQTGGLALLNYESGENVRQISSDNLIYQLLSGFSTLGITAGDLDADGNIELIGTGPSHTGERYDAGEGPIWFRTAEFQGGDVEDPANYIVEDVEFAFERSESRFDRVERDDQGTMSVYHEDPSPEFSSKFVYLGDADMDGINEVAFGIQGVADETVVISEVFNPSTNLFDRTTVSTSENDGRVFMKITSCPTGQGKALNVCGLPVDVEEERIVLPSDYKLFDNYPNPFNPSTTIGFELPLDKNINVRIYDVSGRLVRTLISNQFLSAGTHEVIWDGQSDAGVPVASGTYIYALEYGNFRQAKEMVLVK